MARSMKEKGEWRGLGLPEGRKGGRIGVREGLEVVVGRWDGRKEGRKGWNR